MIRSFLFRFLVFAQMLVLFSCEEATDWPLQSEGNGQLVVEAIITNEVKYQAVWLSLSFDHLNETPPPVTDAVVSISNGQNTLFFTHQDSLPGLYLSNQPAGAQISTNHVLTVDWNGQTYTAESQSVPVFLIPEIGFRPHGQTDSLQLRDVGSFYSPQEQAMYEVDIDWRHLVESDSSRAKLFYYTLTTLDVNELFRPDRVRVPFPKGSIVIVKKYSLNDDFAAYVRAILMETDWQGGVLDEASSSVPTNISNGGLGFFSTCAVRVDTVVAE